MEDRYIDFIYDVLDELMIGSHFEACDQIFRRFCDGSFEAFENIPLAICVGFLTATLPAKSKMPNRAKFHAMVGNRLVGRYYINLEGLK